MGYLSVIDPRWISHDGEDIGTPRELEYGPGRNELAIVLTLELVQESIDRGDIDVEEAATYAHTVLERIRTEADRIARQTHSMFHADRTSGETAEHAPAPNQYVRVQSDKRTRRTNSGRTETTVDRHGRSYVGGSFLGSASRECTMSADVLAHALATVPRTTLGHADGIAVSRLTDIAYPDLPRLVGGDTVGWQEFEAWDDVRARAPRRGPATRYELPTLRYRKSERGAPIPTATHGAVSDVPSWEPATRVELLAPSDKDGHAYLGFRLVKREDPIAYQSTPRPVDERFTIDSVDSLPELVRYVATTETYPYRGTWVTATGDHAGTVTIANDKDSPLYRIRFSGRKNPVMGRTITGAMNATARVIANEY